MQQLMHALSNIKLGLGVVEGLKISTPSAGNVAATEGMARLGTPAGTVPTNKAEYGMNRPGIVKEVAAIAATAVIANATAAAVTQLVWLNAAGNALLVTRDRLPGESYADVLVASSLSAQLQDDPFAGAMVDGRAPGSSTAKKLQEGPLRGKEPACVLLAKITVAASSSTVSAIDNTVKTRVLT